MEGTAWAKKNVPLETTESKPGSLKNCIKIEIEFILCNPVAMNMTLNSFVLKLYFILPELSALCILTPSVFTIQYQVSGHFI